MEEDGDGSGAQEHRVNVVDIDAEKGTAAGYIAKYISKGIDGYGMHEDLYGHDAASSAERIKAWASTWGIRQFQQIGGVSVTVYRELRRLNGVVPKSVKLALDDPEQFAALVEAADKGDWHAFTNLMGGVNVKRKDQLLRACYLIKEQCGKYQETASKLIGVLVEGVKTVLTRIRKWTVKGINRAVNVSLKDSGVFLTEGLEDPPWSSVNKCTRELVNLQNIQLFSYSGSLGYSGSLDKSNLRKSFFPRKSNLRSNIFASFTFAVAKNI